jgi:hypothetical protein
VRRFKHAGIGSTAIRVPGGLPTRG